MINFYDFEVFAQDWLCVIINPFTRTESVIVNDREALEMYYNEHKNQIWCGYNSREYDTYILKGILCGFNPKKVNDYMIVKGNRGWSFSSLLYKIKLFDYDTMPNPPVGLKTLEGFMGSMIKETSIPFTIERKLTEKELQEVIKYCRHDVEQTANVFLQRKSSFDAQMALIGMFDLPLSCISKTESRLVAEILDCERTGFDDEWDLTVLPCIELDKYKYVADWFMDKKNQSYDTSLVTYVCGVPHTFAWGGLHGAIGEIKEKVKKGKKSKVIEGTPTHRKGLLLHVDVQSYYPSLLIYHNLITRAARHPERYKDIYFNRLKLKSEGKKAEQIPLKLMLNALSGAMKDQYNKAYDPRNNNLMCVNGQLMLLDLLEKLEGHCEIIQSNTDGIIIEIEDTNDAFYLIDDICYEWEQRTKMGLSLDVVSEIYQKDVNNYLWIDENGDVERIGAYVKELSPLDYDLPIINKALVDYMVDGTPIETTISTCNDLIMYQKIVKLSSKYEFVEHNNEKYDLKCYRVFASNDRDDGKILKCKTVEGRIKRDKFANTPEQCFIENDDINGVKIPRKLNKQWYIDLTKERLKQYGVEYG